MSRYADNHGKLPMASPDAGPDSLTEPLTDRLRLACPILEDSTARLVRSRSAFERVIRASASTCAFQRGGIRGLFEADG